jgi:Zn-dependent protease with chaperone function
MHMLSEHDWMNMKSAQKNVMIDLLLSISFSLFGMLLIFGLGFVFPTINPYVVIKWIIIVAGVVFVVSFLKWFFYLGMKMKMMRAMKNENVEAKPVRVEKAKKVSKK